MAYVSYANEDVKGTLIYWKLMLKGAASISKLLLLNAREVKQLRHTSSSEEHYIRPPRRYDLPAYQPGMQCSTANEKYLRPTRLCDSRAPEVLALAHSLGAYRIPDRDLAQAAFEFAKEKMTLEIGPITGVVENLQRGTGSCFELITVFIALCRCAGIRARYKIFATHMTQAWRDGTVNADPLLAKWYDTLGYFLLEGEGEAFIDGEWTVAHVGPTAERQAAAGIPITHLGEDALGIWFTAKPGSIMRLESLPQGLITGSWLLHRISPGSMERVNVNVVQQNIIGRNIIEQAGGAAAYDRAARSKSVIA